MTLANEVGGGDEFIFFLILFKIEIFTAYTYIFTKGLLKKKKKGCCRIKGIIFLVAVPGKFVF